VIALTLTDFEIFKSSKELISEFIYKEVKRNFPYTDNNMKLVFVELPKFTKELNELETLTDKWIYFIKYAKSLTDVPETMDRVPEIHKAFEIANKINLTREELEEIERREMFIYDQQGAIIKAATEARQEEKQAIARQLIAHLDNATISQTTGLTIEEIESLRSPSI
jgi:predicted transposase/invertase (TIGR01784 family)